LSDERDALEKELVAETFLIDRLRKTTSLMVVDLEASPDYLVALLLI
jgi:hypothetical protein